MKVYLTVPLFIIWSLLVLTIPSVPYFRDGAEFVLSAFFLDIPHPSGFPLYSQTTNIFTWFPLGTIPFRVHVASAFYGLINLLLTGYLTFILIKKSPIKSVCVLLAPCILLASSSYIRNCISAEVYILSSVFLILSLILFVKYQQTKDYRLLLTLGIMTSLSFGVHPATTISLTGLLLFIIIINKISLRNLFPLLILSGLCFITLISYLPIRSSTNPVINSVSINSISDTVKYITNYRDKLLRNPSSTTQTEQSYTQLFNILGSPTFILIRNDLTKLVNEVSLFLLLFFFGSYLLFKQNRAYTGAFIWIILSQWIFFAGWDADPWIGIISIITSTAAYSVSNINYDKFNKFLGPILVIVLILYSLCNNKFDTNARLNTSPLWLPKQILSSLPKQATLISETNWFTLLYSQSIEKRREDIALFYLPEILFPEIFGTPIMKFNNSFVVSPTPDTNLAISENLNFDYFIRLHKEGLPLALESNKVLSKYLKNIGVVSSIGLIEINYIRNDPGIHESIKQLQTSSVKIFQSDQRGYLEEHILRVADSYWETGDQDTAKKILLTYCRSPSSILCSTNTINNLVVYLIKSGEHQAAHEWGVNEIKRNRGNYRLIQRNLAYLKNP